MMIEPMKVALILAATIAIGQFALYPRVNWDEKRIILFNGLIIGLLILASILVDPENVEFNLIELFSVTVFFLFFTISLIFDVMSVRTDSIFKQLKVYINGSVSIPVSFYKYILGLAEVSIIINRYVSVWLDFEGIKLQLIDVLFISIILFSYYIFTGARQTLLNNLPKGEAESNPDQIGSQN